MRALQEKSKFIWLTSLLAEKQQRIAFLIGRLTCLGSVCSVKPGISDKFRRLMQQIDEERDREFEIICEIQDMEGKHREQKLKGRLEKADAAHLPVPETLPPVHSRLWQRFLDCLPRPENHISE